MRSPCTSHQHRDQGQIQRKVTSALSWWAHHRGPHSSSLTRSSLDLRHPTPTSSQLSQGQFSAEEAKGEARRPSQGLVHGGRGSAAPAAGVQGSRQPGPRAFHLTLESHRPISPVPFSCIGNLSLQGCDSPENASNPLGTPMLKHRTPC